VDSGLCCVLLELAQTARASLPVLQFTAFKGAVLGPDLPALEDLRARAQQAKASQDANATQDASVAAARALSTVRGQKDAEGGGGQGVSRPWQPRQSG
jgi:hypothetical protein